MKKLLQELWDLERFKSCLTKSLYEVYREHLYEKILLKEFSTESLYTAFINGNRQRLNTNQRIEQLSRHFKNTTTYEYEPKSKSKVPTFRTHLQLKDKTFCTKEEFEKEFLTYEFDDEPSAKEYLKTLLALFDRDGWLIIPSKGHIL